ncbi:MAG TPA: hypothetical protein VK203_19685 [Nostocaceae cyanobacterium]|nr:hypothetical protein [Nostocaceae cyanobacterium]
MTDNAEPLTPQEYSNFLKGLSHLMFSNLPESENMEKSLEIAQGKLKKIPVQNVDEFIEAVKSCSGVDHPLIISILRGGLMLTEDYQTIGEMFLNLGEVIGSKYINQCLAIALEFQKAISDNYPVEIEPGISSDSEISETNSSDSGDSQINYKTFRV